MGGGGGTENDGFAAVDVDNNAIGGTTADNGTGGDNSNDGSDRVGSESERGRGARGGEITEARSVAAHLDGGCGDPRHWKRSRY